MLPQRAYEILPNAHALRLHRLPHPQGNTALFHFEIAANQEGYIHHLTPQNSPFLDVI